MATSGHWVSRPYHINAMHAIKISAAKKLIRSSRKNFKRSSSFILWSLLFCAWLPLVLFCGWRFAAAGQSGGVGVLWFSCFRSIEALCGADIAIFDWGVVLPFD